MAQLERRLELWKSKGNSESTDNWLSWGCFPSASTVNQIVGKTFSKAWVSKISNFAYIVYLASGHPCSQVTKREGSDSGGVFPRVPQTADQIVFTPGFALLCPLLLSFSLLTHQRCFVVKARAIGTIAHTWVDHQLWSLDLLWQTRSPAFT